MSVGINYGFNNIIRHPIEIGTFGIFFLKVKKQITLFFKNILTFNFE